MLQKMIREMLHKLRQLFCRHDYKLFSTLYYRSSERMNLRYTIRTYECRRCGKTKFVKTVDRVAAKDVRDLIERLKKL